MNMLELKDVGFVVTDDNGAAKNILSGINLTVKSGRLMVITGPNGGGKSTLAKIIMGIEKPTSGKIYFDGKDITDCDITERANLGIGFAFQQPVRFKGLRVRDLLNIAAGTTLSTHTACRYLSEVGLCAAEYIDRELNASLSGGELKRIEIAMLMIRNVKLSIFDEPEAGIDLWSFKNLIQVFEKIRKETEGSIVIISHQERILNVADEIAIISDGKLSAFGDKKTVMPNVGCEDDEFCCRRGK